jgi:hypothetical protein
MSTGDSPGARPDVVSLGDLAAVKEVVWTSIPGLWDLVNNLTRCRPLQRG